MDLDLLRETQLGTDGVVEVPRADEPFIGFPRFLGHRLRSFVLSYPAYHGGARTQGRTDLYTRRKGSALGQIRLSLSTRGKGHQRYPMEVIGRRKRLPHHKKGDQAGDKIACPTSCVNSNLGDFGSNCSCWLRRTARFKQAWV